MSGFWDVERDEGWQTLAARLNEKTHQFWAIDSISNAIKSTLSTEDLLQTIIDHVVEVTGAAAGAIYLVESSGEWTLKASTYIPDNLLIRYSGLKSDSAVIKLVLSQHNPVSLYDLVAEPDSSVEGYSTQSDLQPSAAVPMSSPQATQGIIVLFSRGRKELSEGSLEVLGVIGHFVGLSLANTLAHEAALGHIDRQLEQRLAEMEAILSSMSEGLLICDKEGQIIRANNAASLALGQPPIELIGQSVLAPEWNHLVGEPSPNGEETHGPFSGLILRGEQCHDCLLEIPSGEGQRIVRVSASRIQDADGTSGGAVAVVRDVTEERNAQIIEEEFLSLLSHELRAPLTIISGYAQMLNRKLTHKGLPDEAASAELIKVQVTRMSAMVADLVESGRLEEGIGDVSREKTDLGELAQATVTRIIREQRRGSEKHPISLEVETDLPTVEADPRRLDQVLTNFISNAIRYSPAGGRIDVKVWRETPERGHSNKDKQDHDGETRQKRICVTVTDQGIGVPLVDRVHVFERAFRGTEGQKISAQGLGLGLYICKLIISRQGGEIGVADGPDGKGSTFWFALPIAATQEER